MDFAVPLASVSMRVSSSPTGTKFLLNRIDFNKAKALRLAA